MEYPRTMVKNEMLKLDALLTMAGIPHETSIIMIGGDPSLQIHTPNVKDGKIDAVSHKYSYGGNDGLIEIMTEYYEEPGDGVVGYLTAAKAFEYFRIAHEKGERK